jgi:hypothetical protein
MLVPLLLLVQHAAATPAHPDDRLAPPPFKVGETFEYVAHKGFLKPGTAVLKVAGIDTVRGVPSWRFSFNSEVSVPLFSNSTELTSWTTLGDFVSLRFKKHMVEGGRDRTSLFSIFPDSGYLRLNNEARQVPTSAAPLDDVAFFYFIRMTPLQLGKTYRYDRYYKSRLNPVQITVMKRETLDLPDGTSVPCLVLQPIVNEPGGMFEPRAKARIWLTDDARRIPVQIQWDAKWAGTIKLKISRITEPS